MSLLAPKRRVYHRWRPVLPLYDGRECPDCGAVVCGREARRLHREWHMGREAWEEWATATIQQVAVFAGMQVEKRAGGEAGDGYGRVNLREEDTYEYADRMAGRLVVELDDDEEGDDD